MKHLRNIIAVTALVLSAHALADDYASLDISPTDTQGIGAISADEQKIRFDGGYLRLQLDEGEKAMIYNMKGELVYATNRSGVVQACNLKKGMYIVRAGNVTKKIISALPRP